MKIYEPECVALKRSGAEYVARLLSGKSRQEQLEFWIRRTERLLAGQKQRQANHSMTAHNPASQRVRHESR
jgi:hypothetical protein